MLLLPKDQDTATPERLEETSDEVFKLYMTCKTQAWLLRWRCGRTSYAGACPTLCPALAPPPALPPAALGLRGT